MTIRKKSASGKTGTRKLKLKKETVRDLDVKNRARDVKGGTNQGCDTNLITKRTWCVQK